MKSVNFHSGHFWTNKYDIHVYKPQQAKDCIQCYTTRHQMSSKDCGHTNNYYISLRGQLNHNTQCQKFCQNAMELPHPGVYISIQSQDSPNGKLATHYGAPLISHNNLEQW